MFLLGDILILLILILATYFGYKKGFLKTLTGVVSIILSFIIAMTFSSQIESYIKTTPIYNTICTNIEKNVSKESTEDTEEYNTAKLNMPKDMIEKIKENAVEKKQDITKSVVETIGDGAVKILSIILIFVLVRIIIMLLLSGFGIIKKLPFIGWFDRILGAFFGFLRGFLVVYLLLVVVTVFASFNTQNTFVNVVKQSEFAKVMYNNNVFLDFIYKD